MRFEELFCFIWFGNGTLSNFAKDLLKESLLLRWKLLDDEKEAFICSRDIYIKAAVCL